MDSKGIIKYIDDMLMDNDLSTQSKVSILIGLKERMYEVVFKAIRESEELTGCEEVLKYITDKLYAYRYKDI